MQSTMKYYETFLNWLHEPAREVPADARRFANLVFAHFDAVAETSRQRNNRSNFLAEIARTSLSTTAPECPTLAEADEEVEWPWRRLQRLVLGPFRGFRREQAFDIDGRVVLVYGPNGSGKSSLCEALEFGLLGFVEESGLRRIDVERYLTNIHSGNFERPTLVARNSQDEDTAVHPQPDQFRFCFIEKNRIDAFSRVAARPPGQRADLIATLFGMDQFNSFVSHFNESMDQSLSLESPEQNNLVLRRQALARDYQVVDGERARLDAHDLAGSRYAEAFSAGLTYPELTALVQGGEQPCKLQRLQAQIDEVPPAVIGVDVEQLTALFTAANSAWSELAEAREAFESRRDQVSFRDLYQSVLAVHDEVGDLCPACLTPIEETAENPYTRAENELDGLRELSAVEAKCHEADERLNAAQLPLRIALDKLLNYVVGTAPDAGDSEIAQRLASILAADADEHSWREILAGTDTGFENAPFLQELIQIATDIAIRDERANAIRLERAAMIAERVRLEEVRVWIQRHELLREQVLREAADARARIETFEQENVALTTAAEREAAANTRDRPVKAAYDRFITYLREFRDELPALLIADLNAIALELYNEFNQHDSDADKLAELHLPVHADECIEVVFRGNMDRRVDALIVLSEGHIRCLGLAILLAKAVSMRVPIIIFDDAINAIDHDHRGGIRAALFESDRFVQTQIILTCHSPEFIKDVQNHLPAALRADTREYVLLHHEGDYQPVVNTIGRDSNYVDQARTSLARFNPRDALTYSRKALEIFARRIWRWMESHRVGDLSVKLDGPGKPPVLRVLCEDLRKKLVDADAFVHVSKDGLIDALERLLGIPEGNLIWTYLNKGVHEEVDQDDFDRDLVSQVIRTLEEIDELELRPNR